MSAGTFRGKPLGERLTVEISPRGWAGDSPSLRIYRGHSPVLTAYLSGTGEVTGWLTTWGIHGPKQTECLTAADICDLMGWPLPVAELEQPIGPAPSPSPTAADLEEAANRR